MDFQVFLGKIWFLPFFSLFFFDLHIFQNAQIKQAREKEKLRKLHEKQMEEMQKDIQKVLRIPPYPTAITQISSIETCL